MGYGHDRVAGPWRGLQVEFLINKRTKSMKGKVKGEPLIVERVLG
jgi:hypothetical protein